MGQRLNLSIFVLLTYYSLTKDVDNDVEITCITITQFLCVLSIYNIYNNRLTNILIMMTLMYYVSHKYDIIYILYILNLTFHVYRIRTILN